LPTATLDKALQFDQSDLTMLPACHVMSCHVMGSRLTNLYTLRPKSFPAVVDSACGEHMSRMEPLNRPFFVSGQREQVAALPWRKRDKSIEILLVTSRGTGRWVLPKGWIEPGDEEPAEAAAREALEEAGVIGDISKSGLGFYTYSKLLDGGPSISVRVRVYPLEVKRELKQFKEAGQRVLEWFPALEAADAVKEQGLAAIISAFGSNNARI
jgi:8-oxo-dGTP pyrophosphatase MutT (NUDIX family)